MLVLDGADALMLSEEQCNLEHFPIKAGKRMEWTIKRLKKH